jgi:hypothetical protein
MVDEKEINYLKLTKNDLICHVIGSGADHSNWKSNWIRQMENVHGNYKWPNKCQIYNCGSSATDGAHIFIKNRRSNKYCYILPTCHSCNTSHQYDYKGVNTDWMSAKDGAVCIKIDLNEACLE